MSVEVKTPTHTQFEHSEFLCGEKQSNSKTKASPVTFKFEENHHGHLARRQSDAGYNIQWRKRRLSSYRVENTHHQPGFRRKRFKSTPSEKMVLPSKFLLGGNINDPLNLNSINEEDNEKTPHSSPLPTPAHKKEPINSVPFSITDPLNLESTDDDTVLIGGKKKKRNKKRHNSVSGVRPPPPTSEKRKSLMEALKIEIDEPTDNSLSQNSHSPQVKELSFKFDSSSKADKIVSPVIPQMSPRPRKRKRCLSTSDIKPETSASTSRTNFRTSLSPSRAIETQKTQPTSKASKKYNHKQTITPKSNKGPKFIHGNYNRYYGYRNPEAEDDHRMHSFRKEWFENKAVLDIGCNVGHLTLSLAKDFNPSKVVGVDIDRALITAARKNIRHYISTEKTDVKAYPASCMVNYGPLCGPAVAGKSPKEGFPYNITFIQGNYVFSSDEMVEQQKEEYDVILALSISKWIHLNNGDQGLKRFFKRIFNHLRPGGKLILEPQPWSSYKKKKKLTEEIFKVFQTIKLKPPQFSDYLLREVGFSTCEVIDVPFHKSKGFRRPIQLYTKPDTVSNTPHSSYDVSAVNTPGPALTDDDYIKSQNIVSTSTSPQCSSRCISLVNTPVCSTSCSCSPYQPESPFVSQEVAEDLRGDKSVSQSQQETQDILEGKCNDTQADKNSLSSADISDQIVENDELSTNYKSDET